MQCPNLKWMALVTLFINSQTSPAFSQVTIPDAIPGLEGLEGLQQVGFEQQTAPLDFRSLEFEAGPQSNRSTFGADFDNRLGPFLDLDSFGLPFFDKGLALDDADLSLGPFGINFRRLTASVVFSDNMNFEHDNEDVGVIGVTNIAFNLIFQPLDNFHLLLRGNLVALPFEKEIGINGLGLQDPVNAALGLSGGSRNLTQMQLYYTIEAGDWDIEFLEDFGVQFGSGSSFLSNFEVDGILYAWDPLVFEEIDTTGRYQFTSEGTSKGDRASEFDFRNQTTGNFEDPNIISTNTLGNTIGYTLPLETDLKISTYRQDRWFTQNGKTSQDTNIGGRVLLASNRKNLRFKPFTIFRYIVEPKTSTGWNIGLQSQITDNMNAITSYGQTDGSDTWRIALRHQFNSTTIHALSFRREMLLFDIRQAWDYRISKVLGFKLTGDLIVQGSESKSLTNRDVTDQMFYGLSLRKVFTDDIRWTGTVGFKDINDSLGSDHLADFENRLNIRAWEKYNFLVSHRWRYSNPSSLPGSAAENTIIFQLNRDL
jgi:hypothetical protein